VHLIGQELLFHHLLRKPGLSSSIGKAPGGPLVLQLTALQMCGLEEDFFSIGRNLASEGLEQNLGRVRVIDQLSRVLMEESRQFFQLSLDLCRCDPNCPRGTCFLTFVFRDIDGKGE